MGKKSRHDGIVRDRKNAGGPPLSLAQLCSAPSTYLPVTRIEDLNLVCAQGLPNAEAINFPRIRNWLDSAAHVVDFECAVIATDLKSRPEPIETRRAFSAVISCSRFCKRILVSGTTRRGFAIRACKTPTATTPIFATGATCSFTESSTARAGPVHRCRCCIRR